MFKILETKDAKLITKSNGCYYLTSISLENEIELEDECEITHINNFSLEYNLKKKGYCLFRYQHNVLGVKESCVLQSKIVKFDDGSYYELDWYGDRRWYNQQGQRHREGGLPAFEGANGSKAWWVNGQRHREGGLPAIERANGYKEWHVNGQRIK